MKVDAFREWIARLEQLTPHQRQVAEDHLRGTGESRAVQGLIEDRVAKAPVCPGCGHSHIVRWGLSAGLQRYRCHGCGVTFNALTGTPLAHLRHKEHWLTYAAQMLDGRSVRKSAELCGVHRHTAFRWRHRFLALPQTQQCPPMAGIAEADETYFLASRKGERHLDQAPRKRGGKAAQRGLSVEQIPVLVCRDRTGRTANFVLEKADSKHISIALKPFLPKDLVLCTDGSSALSAAAKKLGVVHQAINLSQGICVSGVFHIQNVNAFDSRLKEWIRRFHGVATHYLANHLGWRRLLERLPKINDPSAFLRAALTPPGLQQITGT